jgi:anthranilate phosphoribosyltransferase
MAEMGQPAPPPPEFAQPGKAADLTPMLRGLLAGRTLTATEMTAAFQAIMTGQAHHGEVGALLALLATRTPTSEEILGAARVMRKHVDPVRSSCSPDRLVDTAGTGGAPKTFNVSTAAAIIAAAALRGQDTSKEVAGPSGGGGVAKHGNRSRTGRGSAEVLRMLGVNIDADRATQARCLDEAGVCFCFAIHHHPASKHAMPVRQALGFPTIFNLLGPLTNPAGARRQLMGVYERRFLRPVAEALASLDCVRAMVVHSVDGLDEISISAPTWVMHVENGRVHEDLIDPRKYGLQLASREAVTARDLDHAATMVRGVIDGTLHGPPRDMALLNAAATLVVAGAVQTFDQGMDQAAKSVDNRAAFVALERLVAFSQQSDEKGV